MEEENVGYEPLLTQTNALGGTFMAIGLILCVIGFMLTLVLFMAHKGGKLGNLNPWKVLVPVWAVVAIASIPGLVHFGSTLFPKPPISQAESAVAAYELICTGFSSDNYKTTKAPSTTSCGVR